MIGVYYAYDIDEIFLMEVTEYESHTEKVIYHNKVDDPNKMLDAFNKELFVYIGEF